MREIVYRMLIEGKAERNVRRLCSTPEGRQALEDALVSWQASTGGMPNEHELETVVQMLCWHGSKTLRVMTFVLVLLIPIAFAVVLLDAIDKAL